jgi:hypothetical protein
MLRALLPCSACGAAARPRDAAPARFAAAMAPPRGAASRAPLRTPRPALSARRASTPPHAVRPARCAGAWSRGCAASLRRLRVAARGAAEETPSRRAHVALPSQAARRGAARRGAALRPRASAGFDEMSATRERKYYMARLPRRTARRPSA